MTLYTEGILWYLVVLDCLAYNIMAWTKGKWHRSENHWLSHQFPLNRFFGLAYLLLLLWVGFTLYRMQLLGFYF